MEQNTYIVRKATKPLNINVSVPGSKSITNRALLLAALRNKKTIIRGALFSDDSRAFIDCLYSLSYEIQVDEKNNTITITGADSIPLKRAAVNVQSAGTAARFITTLLALSKGEYIVNSSNQMKNRPMKPLFDALIKLGANISYIEKEDHFPIKINNHKEIMKNFEVMPEISLSINESTQFLSALLLIGPYTNKGLDIMITSDKSTGSYIDITTNMLKQFGFNCEFKNKEYIIMPQLTTNTKDELIYEVEPDVSAACYFYAMAMVTKGNALVKNVHMNSMQGDIRFIKLLKYMGATIEDREDGIYMSAPEVYYGVDVDMNDYSDQALTLAAIAPFALSTTTIRNIGHIRHQECDRINAISSNMHALNVECTTTNDSVTILPSRCIGTSINTYDDHRVAMAFSIIGLVTSDVLIYNPLCCNKTFEGFFDLLNRIDV